MVLKRAELPQQTYVYQLPVNKFSKSWDFKHQTVDSFFERSIQNVKRTLRKAKYDQQDEYFVLLFSNSQSNENGISPVQKFN